MCHLSNEWLLWRPLKHFLFLVIPEIPLYKYRWSYHCLSISWPSHWHCSWSLDLPTGTAADLLTFPLALQLTSWPSHWHCSWPLDLPIGTCSWPLDTFKFTLKYGFYIFLISSGIFWEGQNIWFVYFWKRSFYSQSLAATFMCLLPVNIE